MLIYTTMKNLIIIRNSCNAGLMQKNIFAPQIIIIAPQVGTAF